MTKWLNNKQKFACIYYILFGKAFEFFLLLMPGMIEFRSLSGAIAIYILPINNHTHTKLAVIK